jgi:PIN domain nuclease of toxin-antitoxin system
VEAEALMEPGCFVSTVNFAEIVAVLRDDGWPDDQIEAALESIQIDIVDFTRPHATDAGFLREVTKFKGLSLGDRSCLALARALHLPALTGDRNWAEVDVGVEIRLIR